MKALSWQFLFVFMLAGLAWAEPGAEARPFVLLELFTSQGCSSCPPADRLLGRLAQEAKAGGQALHVLSFHVDYWDYLGWKDPYSGETATHRQQAYARAFGSSRVYTPQLLINGSSELPGTRETQIRALIKRELAKKRSVELSISKLQALNDATLEVTYSFSNAPEGALLRLAIINPSKKNFVPRGENAGSTLSHTNVVQHFFSHPLKKTSGQNKLVLPVAASQEPGSILGFIQDAEKMEVLAVSR